MKYTMSLPSGREVEVEFLKRDAAELQIRVDGQELDVDFYDVDRLGQFAVRIANRSYAASVEQSTETNLRVTVAGESFALTALDERERAAGELAAARPKAETVFASMPGIVVAVHVEVGQRVEPGQAVLVLEAMKMQNEIKAEHGGVVAEILVVAGENVAGNQAMVRMAPAEVA